jgi:tetratricopeptide (TPR) repeat protein
MSGFSGNWFSRLFKRVSQPEPKHDPGIAPKPALDESRSSGSAYKKGDLIGRKYEVNGVLGKGGFGVVYLVDSRELGGVYALKTFLDEYLADNEVRKRFQKEASIWVDLGHHPYLVRAYYVDEVSGRLYILMEFISPNKDGLNSLEGYLKLQPPDLAQSLCWAIQICHGMEYAYSKGVRAHRDLKPANIMITPDKTVKITDFGLAGVLSESPANHFTGLGIQQGRSGLFEKTILGTGFGTPTHMPPEQFENAAECDERSDIYSFGVVLYQMAAGGSLPFFAPLARNGTKQELADYWQAMRRLQHELTVPRLPSPMFAIIQRCLEKKPEKRYQTFQELRKDLELLLRYQTGEVIIPPQLKEHAAWEWNNKGISLQSLGDHDEAISCFDRALELDPLDASAWSNKGRSLDKLGHDEDAIFCYDKGLELNPRQAEIWNNKGVSLYKLGRYEAAIRCYDQALELDAHYASAWNNKGNSLKSLGCYEETIRCYDQALEIDSHYTDAWNNKGSSFNNLGQFEEAIRCFGKVLDLDPRYVNAWTNKGISLNSLVRYEEAICCYDKALEFDPNDQYAWINKGYSLQNLGSHEEAILCLNKALELDPRLIYAWYIKGVIEDALGRMREAVQSYQQFLVLAPAQYTKQIEYARQRLRELRG